MKPRPELFHVAKWTPVSFEAEAASLHMHGTHKRATLHAKGYRTAAPRELARRHEERQGLRSCTVAVWGVPKHA